ncbi:Na+/H+ antiporter subunit G [Luteimonas sp. e5]
MSGVIEWLVLGLLAVGAAFAFLGSFALVRLKTFFQRLHGPTKASTLGVGCLLMASVLYHWHVGNGLHPRELLITVFLFLTAPVSAHMMAKAALSLANERQRPMPPPGEGVEASDPGDESSGE